MAHLRETNTALQTVLCILERDPQADRGGLHANMMHQVTPSACNEFTNVTLFI